MYSSPPLHGASIVAAILKDGYVCYNIAPFGLMVLHNFIVQAIEVLSLLRLNKYIITFLSLDIQSL